jgi:hypothetical protein
MTRITADRADCSRSDQVPSLKRPVLFVNGLGKP